MNLRATEYSERLIKKNTFASNLLFIKWATIYGIKIAGMNVIKNLPEETTEDIYEAIHNLLFLRFSLLKDQRQHSSSALAINKLSRYFKEINAQGNLGEWNSSLLEKFFPSGYLDDRYSLLECVRLRYNIQWDKFFKIEEFYLNHPHTYNLISDGNTIQYIEYRDGTQITRSSFEKNSLSWQILQAANDNVCSFDQISIKTGCPETSYITNAIAELEDLGLLYSSRTSDEIVTIINTSVVK